MLARKGWLAKEKAMKLKFIRTFCVQSAINTFIQTYFKNLSLFSKQSRGEDFF